ncbi:hypothetical protein ILYODFUR_014345 [Ilyodon furcidens]|uniref:Uncharacterized protein n=1 Tax=Ilyodon furcidens TaxID=33524 RepID=A0ABV0SL48_9TELE
MAIRGTSRRQSANRPKRNKTNRSADIFHEKVGEDREEKTGKKISFLKQQPMSRRSHPVSTRTNPADLTQILTQASRCERALGLLHRCIQLHMLF